MHPAAMTRSHAATLSCAGLATLAGAIGVGRFVYTPILPAMVEDLGLTAGAAGFIASANYAGYLAGALGAARPQLPGHRHAWLAAALLVSAITTGASGLLSDVPSLAVIRFLGGAASAFALIFASAMVLDRLAAGGRPAFSALHFAGVGVGIAASAILVSVLAANQIGWRGQWFASGALAVVALIVAAPLLRPNATTVPTRSSSGDSHRLVDIVLAYGLFGFGYVITATFLVAIVRNEAAAVEPVIWAIVGLTAAPSVAIWAWLGRHIGNVQAFALACVCEAIGVAFSVLWLSASGIALAAALLGGTFMGITALGLIVARERAAGDPRRVLAAMTAAFGVGQIIGPLFAGVLRDALGSFTAPSLVAAAALVLAAALAVRPSHDS